MLTALYKCVILKVKKPRKKHTKNEYTNVG